MLYFIAVSEYFICHILSIAIIQEGHFRGCDILIAIVPMVKNEAALMAIMQPTMAIMKWT